MNVEELISPEHVKSEVERIFNTVVANCGNVHLVLHYVPFGGEAGGEDVIGGSGAQIVILTIPQLEGAWERVVETFREPWMKFKQIREYIKKNDLMKFLIEGDCDTKSQVWLQFRDLLINWGYNEVMNAINRKVHITASRAEVVTAKPKKTVKPIHKNKAVVGTAIATPVITALSFVYHTLPAPISTAIVGVIAFILSVVEHVDYKQILEEIEE